MDMVDTFSRELPEIVAEDRKARPDGSAMVAKTSYPTE